MTARRVAVVTGAAGGLGRAIVRRLDDDGFTVAGLDISEADFADVPTAGFWRCDVADSDSVQQAVDEVADTHGGVDVLVNNAGILSGRSSLLEATTAEVRRFFDVNALGALLTVQSCFAYLRDSPHRGRVINVASRTFFTGSPGQLGYVASKGALLGMSRVMAKELGEYGITVNAVIPAQVATPGTRAHSGDDVFTRTMQQQAIKEFVTPEHFAGLVAYLCSPGAELVTGQTLICDGGGLLH